MCRKLTGLLSLILVLGWLASGVWGQENQITNGEFDNGLTAWYRYGTTGFNVEVVQDAGLSGENAVMLDIFDAASASAIGLARAPMQCEQGQTYPLGFMARARDEREMAVLIQLYKPEGPNWIDVFFERVQLTREPQLYMLQYEHTEESTSDHPNWEVAIYFMLKGAWWSMEGSDLNTKVYLDQVYFGGEPVQTVFLKARGPNPADGATDVPREVAMSWTPGDYAVAHDVYFGTDFNDVNDASRVAGADVLQAEGQGAAAYDPQGRLEFEQTYYWRIDEVNAAPDATIFKGDVWSFTTEPATYAIADVNATSNTTSDEGKGPERLVDGSGLNADDQHSNDTAHMWAGTPNPDAPSYVQFDFDKVYKLEEMVIWNYNMQFESFLGLGVSEATLEYTANGTDWTVLGDYELEQGSGSPTYEANTVIAFGGVPASGVRMTIKSNFDGANLMYGLSEVRFTYVPTHARQPQPADGDTDVDITTALSWRPGRDAASHEIYLDTDAQAVADGTEPLDVAAAGSYSPDSLNLATTYYWRVDEVNDAETTRLWKGDVWSFATETYLVVDDFEAYTDDYEAGEAIWQTWIDGWEDNTNGSQVGYGVAPFAEVTIVNGGWQSMPLHFGNTNGALTSKATRTFAPAQNWSGRGIASLLLYVHGDETNTGGQLYVETNGARSSATAPDVLQTAEWTAWPVDLTTFDTDLQNVLTLTIGIDGPGASGVAYIDDIRLTP